MCIRNINEFQIANNCSTHLIIAVNPDKKLKFTDRVRSSKPDSLTAEDLYVQSTDELEWEITNFHEGTIFLLIQQQVLKVKHLEIDVKGVDEIRFNSYGLALLMLDKFIALEELVFRSFAEKHFKTVDIPFTLQIKHLKFIKCSINCELIKRTFSKTNANLINGLTLSEVYLPGQCGDENRLVNNINTVDLELGDKNGFDNVLDNLGLNFHCVHDLRISYSPTKNKIADFENRAITALTRYLPNFQNLNTLSLDLKFPIESQILIKALAKMNQLHELGVLIYRRKNDYKDFICMFKNVRQFTVDYVVSSWTNWMPYYAFGKQKEDLINEVAKELKALNENIASVAYIDGNRYRIACMVSYLRRSKL